jgi:hypothetical protein
MRPDGPNIDGIVMIVIDRGEPCAAILGFVP